MRHVVTWGVHLSLIIVAALTCKGYRLIHVGYCVDASARCVVVVDSQERVWHPVAAGFVDRSANVCIVGYEAQKFDGILLAERVYVPAALFFAA